MFNSELAERVMHKITDHPNRWDQTSWATKLKGCGSALCFAGHVVTECGYQIDWKSGNTGHAGRVYTEFCTKDGVSYSIREAASKELGIDRERAAELFFSENDRPTLRKLIKKYKEASKYECLTPISP